ncbi:hypothetical protein CK203_045803 [Vitis vinifera]|uniref:Uncharacterized protein n=1 Tax=Vitis vinifera TaxID=29760 RepID=A0A438FM57_VITVI|nr:hypothetical protein CK203_112763 [Vitis vinifera]RVW61077.1 hypothetical protein CK203_045803 [Vitis vinifera]
MSKLLILRLGQNNLTGVIPFTLGNLSSLQQLSMAFNHLEGGIPHDLRTLMGILTNNLSANALPDKLRFSSNRGYPIYFGKPLISSTAFNGVQSFGGGYST